MVSLCLSVFLSQGADQYSCPREEQTQRWQNRTGSVSLRRRIPCPLFCFCSFFAHSFSFNFNFNAQRISEKVLKTFRVVSYMGTSLSPSDGWSVINIKAASTLHASGQ